jgi:PBSX family phage terminase large subunit
MPELRLQYTPFPIHTPFHLSTKREKGLFGAVGSGKTIALCAEAIKFGLEMPGSRNGIIRKTVTSLRDSTEDEFIALLSTPPDEDDDDETNATLLDFCEIRRGNNHIDRLWLPNKSLYLMRGLDDRRKIMSFNFASIYVDEANEINEDDYVFLTTRLRQTAPLPAARRMGAKWPIARQQICVATNPDGHNWAWEYYINRPTKARRYFESTSFDNPTLYNPDGTLSEYLISLLNMPPLYIRRFVLCQHDAFSGQILDFDSELNVHDPFEPPASWDRGMGMDWGIRNPCAIGWWARDPKDKRWYKYREWQTYDPTDPMQRDMHKSWPVYRIAETIRQLEGNEHIKWRVAGPDVFRRHPTGEEQDNKTVAQFFAERGLYFTPGAEGYTHRINALNTQLASRVASIGRNLEQTHKAYQQYRWEDLVVARADRDQPERPRKKDDHLVDADQYFFTTFTDSYMATVEAPKPMTYEESVRQMIRNQVKQRARQRSGVSVMLTRGPE